MMRRWIRTRSRHAKLRMLCRTVCLTSVMGLSFSALFGRPGTAEAYYEEVVRDGERRVEILDMPGITHTSPSSLIQERDLAPSPHTSGESSETQSVSKSPTALSSSSERLSSEASVPSVSSAAASSPAAPASSVSSSDDPDTTSRSGDSLTYGAILMDGIVPVLFCTGRGKDMTLHEALRTILPASWKVVHAPGRSRALHAERRLSYDFRNMPLLVALDEIGRETERSFLISAGRRTITVSDVPLKRFIRTPGRSDASGLSPVSHSGAHSGDDMALQKREQITLRTGRSSDQAADPRKRPGLDQQTHDQDSMQTRQTTIAQTLSQTTHGTTHTPSLRTIRTNTVRKDLRNDHQNGPLTTPPERQVASRERSSAECSSRERASAHVPQHAESSLSQTERQIQAQSSSQTQSPTRVLTQAPTETRPQESTLTKTHPAQKTGQKTSQTTSETTSETTQQKMPQETAHMHAHTVTTARHTGETPSATGSSDPTGPASRGSHESSGEFSGGSSGGSSGSPSYTITAGRLSDNLAAWCAQAGYTLIYRASMDLVIEEEVPHVFGQEFSSALTALFRLLQAEGCPIHGTLFASTRTVLIEGE